VEDGVELEGSWSRLLSSHRAGRRRGIAQAVKT
jgi:hypothetical protein